MACVFTVQASFRRLLSKVQSGHGSPQEGLVSILNVRTRLIILALLGCGAFLLTLGHAMWVDINLKQEQRGAGQRCVTVDTPHYKAVAETLFDKRPIPPIFRERILLPLLMKAALFFTGDDRAALYAIALMNFPTTLALAYLAHVLSGRRRASAFAILLFALYPNAYRYGIQLMPDWLHAQLTVCAFASSVCLLNSLSWSIAAVGLVSWILVLLTRPTFYLASVPLCLLLWPRIADRKTRKWALSYCVVPLLVPIFFAVLHFYLYGVATPTFGFIENLHRAVVPRMRMVERHNQDTSQRFSVLWSEERDRIALQHPSWEILSLYDGGPVSPLFGQAYRKMLSDDMAYVRRNYRLFLMTGIAELRNVLFRAPMYRVTSDEGVGARRAEIWLGRTHKFMLVAAFWGLMLAAGNRSNRFVVFATLAMVGLAMSQALLTQWITADRLRLPVDLLFLPFAAVCLMNIRGMISAIFFLVVGVVPAKILNHFGFGGATPLYVVTIFAAGVWLFWTARVTGSRDGEIDLNA